MRPKGQLFDLKRFRTERGLTQTEVANAVDMPQSFLSAIERGKRTASKALLNHLTRIYKVDDITEYLSDPVPSSTQIVRDVKNSIINSPGGIYLPKEIAQNLSKAELIRLLSLEGQPSGERTPYLSPDASTTLVNLLAAAEERYMRERAKVEELEEEVGRLRIELKQYKH